MSGDQVISLAWVRYTPTTTPTCAFCNGIIYGPGIIRSGSEQLVDEGKANILHTMCYFQLLKAQPGDDTNA